MDKTDTTIEVNAQSPSSESPGSRDSGKNVFQWLISVEGPPRLVQKALLQTLKEPINEISKITEQNPKT